MRVPSYRRHSSGQARVTINGKDHLLGKYGSRESKQNYGRLIAEFSAAEKSPLFGLAAVIKIQDLALAYLQHAKIYYKDSNEYANLKRVVGELDRLYASFAAEDFGPAEYKAVRQAWIDGGGNSRQTINKQMQRLLRVFKWAVGAGMISATGYQAMKCVEPLKRGRCTVRESVGVKPVTRAQVDATLPHLTKVLRDMVRFQLLTGCRPGELTGIKPCLVDRSESVWQIELTEHKTAHRGKKRIIYVGPQGQAVLAPYLLRGPDSYCFSPIESERQRRQTRHESRRAADSCGNRPGYSQRTRLGRKPRREPGTRWTSGTYARAIRSACLRAKLDVWSPNQLRHTAATDIRKQFGLEAASVILGHSELGVTQIYAEADQLKAIEVASLVG